MPNFASVLKNEITRVARKEARVENQHLKTAASRYRTDIATLKRQILELQKKVKKLENSGTRRPLSPTTGGEAEVKRFSPKGLAAQRKRLGLSVVQFAELLGVSDQTIYKWEDGKTRPRASNLPAIAAVRLMSRKDAGTRLSGL